jgi:hypothetical protein
LSFVADQNGGFPLLGASSATKPEIFGFPIFPMGGFFNLPETFTRV